MTDDLPCFLVCLAPSISTTHQLFSVIKSVFAQANTKAVRANSTQVSYQSYSAPVASGVVNLNLNLAQQLPHSLVSKLHQALGLPP